MLNKPLSGTSEFETLKSRLTNDASLSLRTDFTFHDCPLKLQAINLDFRSCYMLYPRKNSLNYQYTFL